MSKFRWPWSRRKARELNEDEAENELGLENIIQSVTDEILKSQQRIRRSGGNNVFFVEKTKISISFVVKKSGSGGINIYAVEAGGSYSSERVHQVELELTTAPPLLESLLPQLETEEALRFVRAFKQEVGE